MPTLQTTTNVTGLTALTAGVNFNGLIVLSAGPGMDQVGCCDFGNECLILQVEAGQLTQASLYRDGEPTSTGLTDVALPYTLPATIDGQYYRLGYLAGNITDRLANLPVRHCRECYSHELTVPDQAALEISQFPANSQLAGSTQSSVNTLQTQVNQLLTNIDDLGASNNSLQTQLTTSQANLASTQNGLTSAQQMLATAQTNLTEANTSISTLNAQITDLQAQITTLTENSQNAAAQAVRSAIAGLELRALSGGSAGKVIQLKPDVAASQSPNGTVTTSSALLSSGKVLNFGARPGSIIPGCAPSSQEPSNSACCLPKSTQSSKTSEDTRSTIAKILSTSKLDVSTARSNEICNQIETEKKKLLVHPGGIEPQEITAGTLCQDLD